MPVLLLAGLLLFPSEALAWGLQTHLFIAQQALPACSPLVLAGACLPDLALAGLAIGTPAFRRAHQWSTLRRIAAAARDDAERAFALGYASHLLADVVAHNRFVPDYEARIGRVPHATHALAEFAMDAHVSPRLGVFPSELMQRHHARLLAFASHAFRCSEALARRALAWLGGAERLLRVSPLPSLCLRMVGPARFAGYLGEAADSLRGIDAALDGRMIDWVSLDPEGRPCDERADGGAGEHVARIVQAEHHP